jgi:hypothetical protein
MPPIKCLAVRKGAFPLGGRSSRAPSASAGGSPRRSRGCARNNAAARCRAAARPDHRAGALGRRLQAQPDHGAAIRLARADRHTEERQDETRADDGEARSGAASDPAPPRTAGVLSTQREAHLGQHAAKLDAASSSPRWAAADQRRPHPAPHLLLARCDARRAGSGHSGAGRTRRPQHHDALHAPVPCVAQPSRLLEQRPPLREENGESWHPSAGKHESFPVERWRPHRDSKWFEAKLTFQTAARPSRPKRSRFLQLTLYSRVRRSRTGTLRCPAVVETFWRPCSVVQAATGYFRL